MEPMTIPKEKRSKESVDWELVKKVEESLEDVKKGKITEIIVYT